MQTGFKVFVLAVSIVSTGALAFALRRSDDTPLATPPAVASPSPAPAAEAPREEAAQPIDLAPVVIVAPAPRREETKSAPRLPRARSLEEMRCSDWRPLTMGGGSVRYCE